MQQFDSLLGRVAFWGSLACLCRLRFRLRGGNRPHQRLGDLAFEVHVHVSVDIHGDGAGGMSRENLRGLGMRSHPSERGKVGIEKLVEAVAFGVQARSVAPSPLLQHVGAQTAPWR